ncbi:MAG: hypothetical protein RL037_1642 [Bacteroidota bacterium]|jgi:hypothetical protein
MTTKVIEVLFITLGILLIIIIYRLVLRRLSKGQVVHSDFCTLYSLETNPVSGVVEFYFSTPIAQYVEFAIWNSTDNGKTLKNEMMAEGGHIIRFDTSEEPNGMYTFGIITKEQKTVKKFEIKN